LIDQSERNQIDWRNNQLEITEFEKKKKKEKNRIIIGESMKISFNLID